MLRQLHPLAGLAGFLTLLTSWISTVLVELFGSHELVVTVKQAIPWGLIVLIPALALTGASGFSIAGNRSGARIDGKRRRMLVIAGLGLLVLTPSAFYLSAGTPFTTAFVLVQAVELLVGAVSLTLMAMSVRDGFELSGRFHAKTGRS
ncbi:hypothetical protein [Nonomuraea roseola]|uniref:Uncharacterized protein n=1 Tax=Nonomuraea roseola TaxID=46179 RepID=A0ABV5PSJ8_9ACTN